MKQTSKVRKLTLSAVMLALGFVLSLVKLWQMPLGGEITLLSMLPICFVSIKYGLSWGLGTSFCFSLLMIVRDLALILGWGLTPGMLAGCFILDYLLAYTFLGVAGLLRKKGPVGMVLGTVIACALRFVTHFIAGIVLWTNVEEFVAFGTSWVNRPVLYSLCYNGAFMLPETIMTAAGIAILAFVPVIKKLIKPE